MTLESRSRVVRTAAVAALFVVLIAVGIPQVFAPSFGASLSTISYAVVGTALVWRRPRAGVGWVLLLFAILWSFTFLGSEVAVTVRSPGLVLLAAWLAEWTWLPALVMAFVVLPIIFPTGAPAGGVWRGVLWLASVVAALFVVATWVQGRLSPAEGLSFDNPLGLLPVADVETVMFPIVGPLLVLGPVAAVLRFRTSTGVERQQIRWFMYGVVTCAGLFIVNAVVDAVGTEMSEATVALALSLPPVGIWVAVTRYRLYDIDRIVSRTVSYGLLTALLIGLYVASVFVLGAVVPVQGDLPVAASTLLVAAVFNPLRRRIQDVVDRQFNRARYNSRRLVESFSHTLRVEHDLAGIGAELQDAVVWSMQPRVYSLWLKEPPTAR